MKKEKHYSTFAKYERAMNFKKFVLITQSEPVETKKSVGLITFMTLSKTLKDLINKCLENGGGY